MKQRRTSSRFQQHRDGIRQGVRQHSAVDFFNALTGPLLLELTEGHLPEHRERLYPPTVALSIFIKQSLEEDGSCQRAVNGWAAQRAAEGADLVAGDAVEPQQGVIVLGHLVDLPPRDGEHIGGGVIGLVGGEAAEAIAGDCIEMLVERSTELRLASCYVGHGVPLL